MALTWGAGTSPFGTFAGWGVQNVKTEKARERAKAPDANGDEAAGQLHGDITTVSATFKCNNNTNTIPANIGEVLTGYVLTGIQIQTSATDFATMVLTGHNHTTNAHVTCRKKAHSITLASAFGATSFLGATDVAVGGALFSGSINITCQHADVTEADGDHFEGENYDPMMEASDVWKGTPTVPNDTSWTAGMTKPLGTPTANTDFQGKEYTGVKSLGAMA